VRGSRPARRFRPGSPTLRIRIVLVAVLAVLSVVVVRVVELQVIQGPALAAAAEADRSRMVELPAVRGAITDRNGVALATTVQARNVTADQTMVTDASAAGTELAAVLGGDAAGYTERLQGTRRFVYVAKNVTPQTWKSVQALQIPGIFSEPTTTRVYPAGDVAANVVGFVGAEGTGLGGMEYGLNTELAGTAGSREYQRSARGQEIPTAGESGTDPVPGLGVQLTIDRDIQWMAQRKIAAKVRAAGADWGQVTVMDPATGQVLALATAPTFDPNRPTDTAQADRGNRALSDAYEPGSTSKVMTMAAVIDQGAAGPGTKFVVPSTLQRSDHLFHDSEPHPVEQLTLAGILAKSSNIGTIKAADRIGGKTLYSYLKKFGVGEPSGLRFPGENAGSVPAPAQWSGTTFPNLAYGQGLSVNSVQAASIYATIANDGVRVAPSLVKGFVRPDGSMQDAAAPAASRVVSAATAATVRRMLEGVVSDQGTAPQAAIAGYRVAGKTGTAQRVDPTCGCYRGYVSSFIGMVPANAPRLVVAVSLSNPKHGKYGSVLAAPVFKAVTTFALQQLRIAPTGTKAPHLKTTWSRR
jgi:cell division protein FtsI (penicillin-binding protein 3)